MAITMSQTFVDALLNHDAVAGASAVADQIGGGTLVIYSGTAPTGANEALSGNTALATFTLSAAASQGTAGAPGTIALAFAATTVTASATGTATFFRFISSGATALIQGLITADFSLSSTSITSGDNVSITGTPTLGFPIT